MQESHYDFIIFGPGCTEFVRVKRIRTHVTDPQEIAKIFGEDVLQIRRVPKTPVVSREIWVLSPWNSWQYFLVLDDRIIEIRRGRDNGVAGYACSRRATGSHEPGSSDNRGCSRHVIHGRFYIPRSDGDPGIRSLF